MILICEGCDLSGKSTLVEALGKKYKGMTLKITDRPLDTTPSERVKILMYYWEVVGFVAPKNERNFVLDRFFPSEMVYCWKRGYDCMDSTAFKEIARSCKNSQETYVIYCDPSLEVLEYRHSVRGDDFINKEELSIIRSRYEEAFSKVDLPLIRIDTTELTTESLEKIHNFIEYERQRNKNEQKIKINRGHAEGDIYPTEEVDGKV